MKNLSLIAFSAAFGLIAPLAAQAGLDEQLAKIESLQDAQAQKVQAQKAAANAAAQKRQAKAQARADERHALEMQREKLELEARKSEIDVKKQSDALDLEAKKARVENSVSLDKERAKRAKEFVDEELAAKRAERGAASGK